MAFQSVPNCANAVIVQTQSNQEVVNVLNFHHDGSYAQVNIDELADIVDEWFATNILPSLTDGLTYLRTDVRGLTNEEDLSATNDDNTGDGGVTGASAPLNCALVITHRSVFTGRSARGRSYVVGIPQTDLPTAATCSATFAADMEDAYNQLRTDLIGSDWEFVIVSRFHAGEKRALGVTFTVEESVARNTRLDTQRRRLPED